MLQANSSARRKAQGMVGGGLRIPLSYWNLGDGLGFVEGQVKAPVRIRNEDFDGWGSCVRLSFAVLSRYEWWIPFPDVKKFATGKPASCGARGKAAAAAARACAADRDGRENANPQLRSACGGCKRHRTDITPAARGKQEGTACPYGQAETHQARDIS